MVAAQPDKVARTAAAAVVLCIPDRYVKQLKMEILTLVASSTNVYEIVGELTEYARDISPDIAREAVKAVGRIALSVRVCLSPLSALPVQRHDSRARVRAPHGVQCSVARNFV